jgi:hypothetical protein
MVLWQELLPVETLISRESALPAGSTTGGRKKISTTNDADKACIVALEHFGAAANVAACIVFHAWRLVFIHHEIR